MRFFRPSGEEVQEVDTEEPLDVTIEYIAKKPLEDVGFGIAFFDRQGTRVYGTNTFVDGVPLPLPLPPAGRLRMSIQRLGLTAGTYSISVSAHPKYGADYDFQRSLYELRVRFEHRRPWSGAASSHVVGGGVPPGRGSGSFARGRGLSAWPGTRRRLVPRCLREPCRSADLPEPEAGGRGAALGPGDVAEMIAAQRRLVEKLSPCSGPDCAELTAHLRTLRLLEEELRRRMPPAPARAHTPIQAARLVSDVFQFEVPPSHRKQLGRAITAAKSGFTQGLKPFHIEMLRPQHAFNREMLGVLEHLYGMSATSSRTDLSEWVRKRLDSRARAHCSGRCTGHRGQGLGRAVRLVKRSYLTALGPLLRELLAGQRQWNQAAVELLAEAVKPQPLSPEEASRRVAELLNAGGSHRPCELAGRAGVLSAVARGVPAAGDVQPGDHPLPGGPVGDAGPSGATQRRGLRRLVRGA